MHIRSVAFATALLTSVCSAATAQETPSLDQMMGCRNIEDDLERLSCFDAAAAAIAGPEERTGERLVVVDLDDAEAIERDSFGFNMPSLPRLSFSILAARGQDNDTTLSTDGPAQADSGAPASVSEADSSRVVTRDESGTIEVLELLVAEVRRRGHSSVLVEMQNGQIWLISEGRNLDLLTRRVRNGTPAVIRRAALDSYLLQFEGRGYAYRASRYR